MKPTPQGSGVARDSSIRVPSVGTLLWLRTRGSEVRVLPGAPYMRFFVHVAHSGPDIGAPRLLRGSIGSHEVRAGRRQGEILRQPVFGPARPRVTPGEPGGIHSPARVCGASSLLGGILVFEGVSIGAGTITDGAWLPGQGGTFRSTLTCSSVEEWVPMSALTLSRFAKVCSCF